MNTEIKREIAVPPTVDELARCFADLDAEEQAHFLNLVGSHFKDFDRAGGLMQMEAIVWWDNIITPEGLWFIQELADRVEHHDSTRPVLKDEQDDEPFECITCTEGSGRCHNNDDPSAAWVACDDCDGEGNPLPKKEEVDSE